MVSVPVVPKLNPNHVGIGSRTERLRVQEKELSICKSNIWLFSFLQLVPKLFPFGLSLKTWGN